LFINRVASIFFLWLMNPSFQKTSPQNQFPYPTDPSRLISKKFFGFYQSKFQLVMLLSTPAKAVTDQGYCLFPIFYPASVQLKDLVLPNYVVAQCSNLVRSCLTSNMERYVLHIRSPSARITWEKFLDCRPYYNLYQFQRKAFWDSQPR